MFNFIEKFVIKKALKKILKKMPKFKEIGVTVIEKHAEELLDKIKETIVEYLKKHTNF